MFGLSLEEIIILASVIVPVTVTACTIISKVAIALIQRYSPANVRVELEAVSGIVVNAVEQSTKDKGYSSEDKKSLAMGMATMWFKRHGPKVSAEELDFFIEHMCKVLSGERDLALEQTREVEAVIRSSERGELPEWPG